MNAKRTACWVAATLFLVADASRLLAGNDDKKAKLRAAEIHVQKLELRAADDAARQIERVDQPLLSFGDPARVYSDGTLWAWGDKGRPVAVMELWQDRQALGLLWIHTLTLTSPRRATLTTPSSQRWQPAELPPKPTVFAEAPSPAPKASSRLRQFKELARRFTAYEHFDPDNSRVELRLLVQPVHRYSDPGSNLQDGAIFILAHGTNPEIVLMIEAMGETVATSRWHYNVLRSTHAETHVQLDGHEVWQCPPAEPDHIGPNKPYWLFVSPVENATTVCNHPVQPLPSSVHDRPAQCRST